MEEREMKERENGRKGKKMEGKKRLNEYSV